MPQNRPLEFLKSHLFIGETGELDRFELVGASPKGLFEQAAQEAVGQLLFHPAVKNGQPVKSQKTIDVVFDPNQKPTLFKPAPPNFSATEK
ncbi:MAG: hypothetical protein FJY56_18260 [Betaproteobacteria bacterium]|nr:hypothetical protein [Betaproteobacteria bacterium]